MKLDITRYWYCSRNHLQTWVLLPFSWLFRACVTVRQALYRFGWLKTQHFAVPVIVVGNVTVGGTGKTPMVIWLAQWLTSLGYKPGIVSRGAGGQKLKQPCHVQPDSSTTLVGDEAVMLAQSVRCPVVVGIDRAAVVQDLLRKTDCDVVISDDGMQHYRLGRDIEIAMVDGERRLGNRCLLPAGPLREPAKRLDSVDLLVVNGGNPADPFTMTMALDSLVSLSDMQQVVPVSAFPSKSIHAVAGIGHPQRFFQALRQAGFDVIEHAFPDHYAFQPQDIVFQDELPVIMTEKDAVKCKAFAKSNYWYARTAVRVSESFQQQLLSKLKSAGGKSCVC